MRRLLFASAMFLLAMAAFAPAAQAQLQYNNNSTCPADMSYNQCLANGYTSTPTSSGSSGGTCGTVNSYESCMNYCACQYNKNVKDKCGSNAGLACRDVYLSERHACEGHCVTDW